MQLKFAIVLMLAAMAAVCTIQFWLLHRLDRRLRAVNRTLIRVVAERDQARWDRSQARS